MDFHVIIPARYDSSRLPGKVLADIDGKPMIQHVFERSVASGALSVVVATDDQRIAKVAENFGAKICMTAAHHQSSTERLAEAAVLLDFEDEDVLVNVQSDEPLISPRVIRQLANDLIEKEHIKVSTLCQPIQSPEDLFNSDIVKMVMNHRNYAMYFSRAAIPWDREKFTETGQLSQYRPKHWQHIGIFAYRVNFLQEYIEWPSCPLEEMEALEQLRILWNGVRVHVLVSEEKIMHGVKTEADLEKIRKYVKENGNKF